MKLTVDFSALRAAVKHMGAKTTDFDFIATPPALLELDFDLVLGAGVEIKLDDLEDHGGLLGYKGRQVLLYIPDHGGRVPTVLHNGEKGNRFHVADCSKLEEMRRENRFERYIATNDLSGKFKITGTIGGKEDISGLADLKVCKLCLGRLNYKGYRTGPEPKYKVFGDFLLAEFFARHSTIFSHIPQQLIPKSSGYSKDWEEVSRSYRTGQGYCCEQCTVNLHSDKALLHCHHISGVKSNNSPSNLQALCIDCHRKQPKHQHMHVRAQQMHRITQLRREQGLLDGDSWDTVLEMADTSFHGLLLGYRKAGIRLPEIGYDVQNELHEVVASLEVAWPKNKKGVVIEQEVPEALTKLGWKAQTLGEAVAANAQ